MAAERPAATAPERPPFIPRRDTTWCVMYRKTTGVPWKVWSERGSHHGASCDLDRAKSEGTWGELRIAKRVVATEWTWDE